MRRFAALVLFVSGAAGANCALEEKAPLSDSKQRLQALKAGQSTSAQGDVFVPDLAGVVPQVSAPGAAAQPVARSNHAPESGEKAIAGRSWLVDGYRKLGRIGDPPPAPSAGRDDVAMEESALDPQDPDYFLRLYERQRAATMAERRASQRSVERGERALATDAVFAPFMQNWLAGSPVKEALRDVRGYTTGDDARFVGAASPVAAVAERGGLSEPSARFEPEAEAGSEGSALTRPGNPYLRFLDEGERRTHDSEPASVGPVGGLQERAAPTMHEAPPPPKANLPFRPPPSLQDEKKYFPQLKKF